MLRDMVSWYESLVSIGLRSVALASCLLLGLPTGVGAATEEAVEGQGVVVEEVGRDSALEKAGIQPGDILLSWRRLPNPPANPDPAKGAIVSPFDWLWMVREQAPRGSIEITGLRGAKSGSFRVNLGKWEQNVRPWMTKDI